MLPVVAYVTSVIAFGGAASSAEGTDPTPKDAAALHGRRARPATRSVARTLALLLALAPAAFPQGAAAVTIGLAEPRPWNGADTNPCGGLCDARWALDRMQGHMPPEVHRGLQRQIDTGEAAQEYTIVTGDDIRAMSHARAGVPFVDGSRRVARFPNGISHPALGYFVGHDGLTYRFVRIAALGNWTLIVDQSQASLPAWLSPEAPDLFGDLVTIGGGSDRLAPAGEDRLVPLGSDAGAGGTGQSLVAIVPSALSSQAHVRGGGGFGGGFGGGSGGGSGGRPAADPAADPARTRNAGGTNAGGGPAFPPFGPVAGLPLPPFVPQAGPGGNGPGLPGAGGFVPSPPPSGGPGETPPPVNKPLGPSGPSGPSGETGGGPHLPPGGEPPNPPGSPQERVEGTTPPAVPLPGTLALLLGSLGALGALRRRRA